MILAPSLIKIDHYGERLTGNGVKSETCWIIWGGVHLPRALRQVHCEPRILDQAPL